MKNVLLLTVSVLNFVLSVIAILYDAGPSVFISVICMSIFILLQLWGD